MQDLDTIPEVLPHERLVSDLPAVIRHQDVRPVGSGFTKSRRSNKLLPESAKR
jgi:hypothetical protein